MIKICNIKLLLPNRTQSIRSTQRRTLGIQLCGAFYFLGVKDKLLKWKQKKIKIKLQDVAVSEKHDINQWVLVQWTAIFVMQIWHSKWPRGYKNIWSHLQMSLRMETLQKCLITVHSEAQSNLYFCFIQMHCHDNYISRAEHLTIHATGFFFNSACLNTWQWITITKRRMQLTGR